MKTTIKKIALGSVVFWLALSLCPFFRHTLGQESQLSAIVYNLALYVPTSLLLLLVLTERRRLRPAGWLESQYFWTVVFLIAQVITGGFFVYIHVLKNPIVMRGMVTTAGLAISVGMYLMTQSKTGNYFTSGILGALAVAFYAGALEIPYQIAGYYLTWGSWMGPANFHIVLYEQTLLALPFIASCLLYKIRPTRLSLVSFVAWSIVFAVWIFGFDFWHIELFEVGKEVTYNLPINQAAYYMNKLYCVTFALIVLGFSQKAAKPEYDWEAFSSWNLLRRWWKKNILKKVCALAGTPTADAVLDVGCGSSQIITHFPHAIGIDIDKDKIEFMRQQPEAARQEFKCMDGQKLEFEDGSFDLVLCVETIEHQPEADPMLSEIARVLRPSGHAVIATPDNSKPLWKIIQFVYNICGEYRGTHTTLFTPNALKTAAEKHNLRLIWLERVAKCDMVVLFEKEDSTQILAKSRRVHYG